MSSRFLRRLSAAVLLALLAAWPAVQHPSRAFGATLTVNSTGAGTDFLPGNGVCETAAGNGECTLRAAASEANSLPGYDFIHFSIGGGGVAYVPAGVAVLDGATIDGTTQPGYAGIPLIRTATTELSQFNVSGIGSVIRGIAITRGIGEGIWIRGGNSNIVVEANYIGTEDGATADPALRNGAGVRVSANNAVVGSLTAGIGNVISNNTGDGIVVDSASTNTNIVGNLIGVTADGTSPLWNAYGVRLVSGDDSAVGAANGRNVISGTPAAILVMNNAANSKIQGNYISSDATGNAHLGDILGINDSGISTTIGGSAAGEGNLLARGILEHRNATIIGNRIGVKPDGSGGFSNPIGIELGPEAYGVKIGGVAPGEGNIIASNSQGVVVAAPSRANTIRGNSIWGNTSALGIDLVGATTGRTPNDPLDADTAGGNFLQNWPDLGGATATGVSALQVEGSLSSSPNASFTLDFYTGFATTCPVFGIGEARRYAGSQVVATGGSGVVVFSLGVAFPGGTHVTATATDSTGNTSELGNCIPVSCFSGDTDCDGHADVTPPKHFAPANENTAYDNCFNGHNPEQVNIDGDFLDLSPPKAYDDLTQPRSDGIGDDCEYPTRDLDNDGLSGGQELFAANCAGYVTDPHDADTDNDRALDGAECMIGTDPTNALNAPTLLQCTNAYGDTDADGDRISAGREGCYYNTFDNDTDSDDDGCSDTTEVASINADRTVNAIDLLQVSVAFGPYYVALQPPDIHVRINFDVNKDGTINSLDLLFLALTFGPC